MTKSRLTAALTMLAIMAVLVVPGCTIAKTDTGATTEPAAAPPTGSPPAGGPPAGGPPPAGLPSLPAAAEGAATDYGPQEVVATIDLPEPDVDGDMSLEEALAGRRSIRSFSDSPLTIEQVSQLLWAAQGITSDDGKRTAPSAVQSYPLDVYVAVYNVDGLEPGIYRYIPDGHQAAMIAEGDQKAAIGSAYNGAVDLIITADFTKLTSRFGDIGERFALLEAGHAAQNVCLQATALGIGTVTTGAFRADAVSKALSLPAEVTPVYVMPTGGLP